MKKRSTKGVRLNYKITDKKIRDAVIKVIESGADPTVKLVAKEAGISLSTAYAHRCQKLILDTLKKK